MSGYDNSDFGQDALLPGASFDPNDLEWNPEDYLFADGDHSTFDGTARTNMEIAEINTSILPNAPFQEDRTLFGTTHTSAGFVTGTVNQFRYPGQPMLTSPLAQTFGAEPMSSMPLVNSNQGRDQLIHSALPAQTFEPQHLPSKSSPNNYDMNSYNAMGVNKNPTWSPTGADLPQQNLPTSGYPVPPQQQQWWGLEHTQFQQAGQTLAGADAVDSHSNFQPNIAGNHFFVAHTQGGPLNASHGFLHLAAAPVRRTLASKPASDAQATAAMAQGSNDDATPVPPPVAPEKKETKAKQTTRERKRPTTSKAKKPVVKKALYDSQLPVMSLEDAKKAVTIKRFELKVVDDDWKDVAAQQEDFVSEIVKALEMGYRLKAEEHDRLTAEGRTEFTRWQKEHENKVWAYLDDEEVKNAPEYAKACATILFHRLLEAHQSKFIADPGKAVSNGSVDVTTKCSERMKAATTAIREYPIVKYDFLRRERLDALLASPRGFVGRKTENMTNNYQKKQGVGPVKLEAEESGSAARPKTKSQGKRKRKEPSPPPSDDEDEEDEDFEQPAKRTRRR